MSLSALTVPQIKRLVDISEALDDVFLEMLASDPRRGVRRIYLEAVRRKEGRKAEEQRLKRMFERERILHKQSLTRIAGVDEAGRGPLAGPVVAAAVMLPQCVFLEGLDDSKKLTPKKREKLAMQIKKLALDWSIALATVEEIQVLNIRRASLLAMRRAVCGLKSKPQYVMVDGRDRIQTDLSQETVVGGDRKVASIAAASILAKVTRDDYMNIYHCLFPQYGFNIHKGYGTAGHLQALARYGSCPIHRANFLCGKGGLSFGI